MMRWLVAALAALTTLAVATPAASCIIVTRRCDPDGCNGPLYLQAQSELDRRAAIEYGREIAQAMNARVDSPSLDRGYDLANILLPNVFLPVALLEDDCSGTFSARDEDGGGSISIEDAELAIRRERNLPQSAPIGASLIEVFDRRQNGCNAAVRRDLATYLNAALPADQLRELWTFLLPRSGAQIPRSAEEQVSGARLLFYGPDGNLVIPSHDVGRASFVIARRERAWHYLRNHRNGRIIMAALNQFVASRLARPRDLATICPGV